MAKVSKNGLLRSLYRKSFTDFVKGFWEFVPGAGKLIWNWHMDVFCTELQRIAERVFANKPREYDLVCNVSPGTSKSTIFSILFQPWTWTIMPEARHIVASHTETLVFDFANKSREVVLCEKYQELFPHVKINPKQDSKGYFSLTVGGDRLSCTVGGKSPMGFHAHFLSVDDPIDPKKAVSELELKNASDFMTQILPSRKVNKEVSVTFMVMQRLHEGDPTGVMLEGARREDGIPVRHICLPAELAANVNPPELAQYYVNGLMDPARLSAKVLKEARSTLLEYGYAAQFMQHPVPLGGGMFREEYFSDRVKAAPYQAQRVRYWDRASSLDYRAARTAGTLIARDGDGIFYIEHVVHGQWEPDARNQQIKATALRDRARYGPKYEPVIVIEAEGGSSGRDAWKAIARMLAGFNVREDRVTGSKETRAEPWSAQLAAMCVKVVQDGTWDIEGYIAEHLLFPNGRLKDRVDSSTGGFNFLANRRAAPTVKIYPLRRRDKHPRIYVVQKETIAQTIVEEKSLFIDIRDPGAGPPEGSPHTLTHLLDRHNLYFLDAGPEDYQSNWEEPVPAHGKLPQELLMDRESGKKLWSFILKKRETNPAAIVVQDNGDRRALSLAYALCDGLYFPRSAVFQVADPDNTKNDGPAPNRHVYDMVRSCRHLVVG